MGNQTCGESDSFCGGGVSRPSVEESTVGKGFIDLMKKADSRTQQLFNLMSPILKGASGQAMDILQGGTGSLTPAIQQATTSAQGALSNTMASTQERLDRAGITGTDAVRIMSDTERQGSQQVAGVPTQMTLPILQQIFASLTGSPALAIQSQQGAMSSSAGVTAAGIQPIKGNTMASYAPQVMGCGPTGG